MTHAHSIRIACVLLVGLLLPFVVDAQSGQGLVPDAPIRCNDCDAWNQPQTPFRVFGNTYYVGTKGLGSILITSPRGHILIDGGLPQSAPLIDASIQALGFQTRDIKAIAYSHAHFDHVGGIAALQRASRATVWSSAAGRSAMTSGVLPAEDPQVKSAFPFPPVKRVSLIKDAQAIRVGDLAITPHLTPGHTPGGTTWSWRSCEGGRCLDIVYADSLTAVSDDGFRFTGDGTRPAIVGTLRSSIARVAALPCDIILSTHPGFVNLDAKWKRLDASRDDNPFVDPGGCRAYADAMSKRLEDRVASEK
jgi:metallo-beta-lactamase class B